MDRFDWTLAQSFVAVADCGSLSAAARQLGQSQPTLGRHIKLLEAELGVSLFRRVPKGLDLTDAGAELVGPARQMAGAAAQMRLVAEGKSTDLSGTVRITASVVMSHFVLPPIIARVCTEYPDIQIELVPSDVTENLLFREADMAVRMYRPEQLDIVARHVADRPTGLYAAHTYVDKHGAPTSFEQLLAHDVVGFDRDDLDIRLMRGMGVEIDRDFFRLRCDDQAAYWHLVRAGCGIGAMQCAVADADPLVRRIMPDLPFPTLPVWLAAPKALSHTPRMRVIWDILADELGKKPHSLPLP